MEQGPGVRPPLPSKAVRRTPLPLQTNERVFGRGRALVPCFLVLVLFPLLVCSGSFLVVGNARVVGVCRPGETVFLHCPLLVIVGRGKTPPHKQGERKQ